MKLSNEQIQDIMHAIRHYQYHHISISNPRYEEFSNILNILVEEIKNENFSGYSGYLANQDSIFDWLDRRGDNESNTDPKVGT